MAAPKYKLREGETLKKFRIVKITRHHTGYPERILIKFSITYRAWFHNAETGKTRRNTHISMSNVFNHCVDEMAAYTQAIQYIKNHHPNVDAR